MGRFATCIASSFKWPTIMVVFTTANTYWSVVALLGFYRKSSSSQTSASQILLYPVYMYTTVCYSHMCMVLIRTIHRSSFTNLRSELCAQRSNPQISCAMLGLYSQSLDCTAKAWIAQMPNPWIVPQEVRIACIQANPTEINYM